MEDIKVLNVDASTPEGKKELEDLLLNAVLNSYGDLVPAPYRVDNKAYENYQKAVLFLLDLQAEGKCTFDRTPLDDPYDTHCIYVQWIIDENNGCQIDRSEIINLMDKFESLAIYKDNPEQWQLITHIYFPA